MTVNEIKKILRRHGLQLTLQSVGFIVVVANLWIASKLAPVAKDLAVLTERVHAAETSITTNEPLIPRFLVVEKEVELIRDRLDRFEGKLDRVIESKR